MAERDRTAWEDRYAGRVRGAYPDPDRLLVRYALPAGAAAPLALDLAAGQCQNALWLAEQGYRVIALDISRIALQRGRAEAARRGLHGVAFAQADLDHLVLPAERVDLVCGFRFLDRALFPQLRAALRPGGRVIYQTFNKRRLIHRPESRAEYLLEPGELRTHFPGWHVLHDEDTGDRSRFVAVKPPLAPEDVT